MTPVLSRAWILAVLWGTNAGLPGQSSPTPVGGMQAFRGTPAERAALERHRFVVVDQTVSQFFAAYRPENPLPFFVTTDAVWHAFTHLLKDAVIEIDRRLAPVQAAWIDSLLRAGVAERSPAARDASRLLALALARSGRPVAEEISTTAPFRWAQATARQLERGLSLRSPAESALDLSGLAPWALEVDLGYDAAGLAGFFRARRVLQLCRLRANPRGREAARVLHRWIAKAPEATRRLAQLRAPMDLVFGAPLEATHAALLPPAGVPSARVFVATTHPRVTGRALPSGADLWVLGPLASPAGRSLFQALPSTHRGLLARPPITAPQPHPTPRSVARPLAWDALVTLRQLTDPLPGAAPRALRSDAWLRKQCETQLAGWAEARMAAVLHGYVHTTLARSTPSRHQDHVSPYPEFFDGVADLATRLLGELQRLDRDLPLDLPAVAAELLAEQQRADTRTKRARRLSPSRLDRLLASAWRGAQPLRERERWIRAALRRSATRTGPAAPEERDAIRRAYFGGDPVDARLAALTKACRRLADVARTQLAGRRITAADTGFLRGIGQILARTEGYLNNSWWRPRDDFPRRIVVATAAGPGAPEHLVVGVARPRLLYVVIESGGGHALYRGAVSTFREQRCTTPPSRDEWRSRAARLPPLVPSASRAGAPR